MCLTDHNNISRDHQHPTPLDLLACAALLLTLCLVAWQLGGRHDRTTAPDCSLCHSQQARLAGYLRAKGNPTPEALAEAVIHTRSPRLMAAIAVRGERNTPYWIRHGGRAHAHAGAWQVNGKMHGAVSYDVTEQALQSELILTDLVTEHHGDVVKALNAYGGDTHGRYADRVLAELATEVPR